MSAHETTLPGMILRFKRLINGINTYSCSVVKQERCMHGNNIENKYKYSFLSGGSTSSYSELHDDQHKSSRISEEGAEQTLQKVHSNDICYSCS